MVRKSDGEKIDELTVLAAVLAERLDNMHEGLDEVKRELEEARRRMWLLVPPIVAALLSVDGPRKLSLLASLSDTPAENGE